MKMRRYKGIFEVNEGLQSEISKKTNPKEYVYKSLEFPEPQIIMKPYEIVPGIYHVSDRQALGLNKLSQQIKRFQFTDLSQAHEVRATGTALNKQDIKHNFLRALYVFGTVKIGNKTFQAVSVGTHSDDKAWNTRIRDGVTVDISNYVDQMFTQGHGQEMYSYSQNYAAQLHAMNENNSNHLSQGGIYPDGTIISPTMPAPTVFPSPNIIQPSPVGANAMTTPLASTGAYTQPATPQGNASSPPSTAFSTPLSPPPTTATPVLSVNRAALQVEATPPASPATPVQPPASSTPTSVEPVAPEAEALPDIEPKYLRAAEALPDNYVLNLGSKHKVTIDGDRYKELMKLGYKRHGKVLIPPAPERIQIDAGRVAGRNLRDRKK